MNAEALAQTVTTVAKSEEATDEMRVFAETTPEQVANGVGELVEKYKETGRAFTIVERPGGWRLCASPEFADWSSGLFPERKPSRLSPPALETLSIIAYRQPITKANIEAVRGVSVDGMMQKLMDRSLIKIVGRAELPGRPLLYGTTDAFLEHFGVKTVDDLPNADELRRVELPTADEGAETEAEKQLALSGVAPGVPRLEDPTPNPEAESNSEQTVSEEPEPASEEE